MVENGKEERTMDVRVLGFKNSLARRFSSLITASRITIMKQMLQFHLKATKYGLNLRYGSTRRT